MVTMWINAPIVIYSKETDNTNTNKYQVSKKIKYKCFLE